MTSTFQDPKNSTAHAISSVCNCCKRCCVNAHARHSFGREACGKQDEGVAEGKFVIKLLFHEIPRFFIEILMEITVHLIKEKGKFPSQTFLFVIPSKRKTVFSRLFRHFFSYQTGYKDNLEKDISTINLP